MICRPLLLKRTVGTFWDERLGCLHEIYAQTLAHANSTTGSFNERGISADFSLDGARWQTNVPEIEFIWETFSKPPIGVCCYTAVPFFARKSVKGDDQWMSERDNASPHSQYNRPESARFFIICRLDRHLSSSRNTLLKDRQGKFLSGATKVLSSHISVHRLSSFVWLEIYGELINNAYIWLTVHKSGP